MTEKKEDEKPDTPGAEGTADPRGAANDASANEGGANDGGAKDAGAGRPVEGFAEKARAGDRLAEVEAEVARLKDQLLRAMAETENVRKRAERQVEDAHRYAVTAFARDVLSVADNLERALGAIPAERRGEHELLETLLGGLEAVQADLERTLAQHKIRRIDPHGETFDPNLHEAMFEVPGGEHPDGTVAQVVQPGYMLEDRLLRPARVGVAKSADGGRKVDTSA